jgi:hypothetical protein
MRSILKQSGVAVALFFVVFPITAHHGPGNFDRQREITLDGVVTRFLWASPHVYIDLRTSNTGNETETWSIEGSPPSALARIGWSRESLVDGDRVTVIAFPPRDPGRKAAAAKSVLKADGTLLSFPQSPADTPRLPEPFVAPDLSGHWLLRFDPVLVSQSVDPGSSWALTEKGIEAVENFDPNVDMPAKDCISESVPFIMLFPDMLEIELGEDIVLIRQEDQIDRIVYMGLESHEGAQPSHQGHSIGRWEGEDLVVDTRHFSDHRIGNGIGLPSGSQKHLIERFALTPDGTSLDYTYRLEDGEFLAEPVTGNLRLTYRPDLPFVNVPCDPESASRYVQDAPL